LGPNGVTFAFGSIWVANHHGASVTRVDPQTGATTATIQVGGTPGYVTSGFGSIWVTDYPRTAAPNRPEEQRCRPRQAGTRHAGFTGCGAVPSPSADLAPTASTWCEWTHARIRRSPRSGAEGSRRLYYCASNRRPRAPWSGVGPGAGRSSTNHVAKTLLSRRVPGAMDRRCCRRSRIRVERPADPEDSHAPASGRHPTDLIVVFSPGRAWIIDDGDDSLRK
jgi:hypothetical protein